MSNELLDWANSLLYKARQTHFWTKKEVDELKEALFTIQIRLNNLRERILTGGGGGGGDGPKGWGLFMFLQGEVRLWATKRDFVKFATEFGLVEGEDFEYCKPGAVYVCDDATDWIQGIKLPPDFTVPVDFLPNDGYFNVNYTGWSLVSISSQYKGKGTITATNDGLIGPALWSKAVTYYKQWYPPWSLGSSMFGNQLAFEPKIQGSTNGIIKPSCRSPYSGSMRVAVAEADIAGPDEQVYQGFYYYPHLRYYFPPEKVPQIRPPPIQLPATKAGKGLPVPLPNHYTCIGVKFLRFTVVPRLG